MISKNKEYWENAARENAMFHVASSKTDWKLDEFLNNGKEKVYKWVMPFLLAENINPSDLTFLEIGCGTGRFAFHITQHVNKYIGVDISQGMVDEAEKNLSGFSNKDIMLGDGVSLSKISDNSVDAVFSYAVLQHVYEKEVVFNYLNETLRVLKPGGVAKLNLLGSNAKSGIGLRFIKIKDLKERSIIRKYFNKILRKIGISLRVSENGYSRKIFIRLLKKLLPEDFILPLVSNYKGGIGMRGEGIGYKAVLNYLKGMGCEVRIENFESANLSHWYWVLIKKNY